MIAYDDSIQLCPQSALTWEQIAEVKSCIAQHDAELRPQLIEQQNAERETLKHTIEVYLSSRGWGDYSPVTVKIDTRKSEAEWIKTARHALEIENDVDEKNMTDDEILSKINAVIKERDEKAARKLQREQKNKEREERRKLYTVTTHKTVQAWGGEETGQDGFWDATVTDKDGNATRVIIRNVFDFGYYGYPYRLAGTGTDNVFNEDVWTQTERDAVAWALDFSPIDHETRM